MSIGKTKSTVDPEILAIGIVNDALKGLGADAQQRVLDYVATKLLLRKTTVALTPGPTDHSSNDSAPLERVSKEPSEDDAASDLDGVSPVAIKWMRRNGLTAAGISKLYSLGVDEIDFVAQTVPGKSKRERMHNALLLKGVAAYLSAGAARFTHDQIKEACLHYDAYDPPNFARYIGQFAPEVSGSKDTGYTLTARGLSTATELIKGILSTAKT